MTYVNRCKGWRIRRSLILQSFVASPTSQLILQPFRRFTYVTVRSITVPLLHLRHRHFTYFTAHSPTLLQLYLCHSSASFSNPSSLHLRHSLFSNPSAALSTSHTMLYLIRRFISFYNFHCFTYVIDFSPTSQFIFQPFRRFTYVTAHSTTVPLLHIRHRHLPTSPGEPHMPL